MNVLNARLLTRLRVREVEMRRKLTGVIYSDLGQASRFMALDWVQKALREALGFSPYPATLNLRLVSEKDSSVWQEVRRRMPGIEIVPPDPAFCRARCFLVEIEGKHKGAVLLPEVKDYPADKIEVVAPVRLKDDLSLKDGDTIAIEFEV